MALDRAVVEENIKNQRVAIQQQETLIDNLRGNHAVIGRRLRDAENHLQYQRGHLEALVATLDDLGGPHGLQERPRPQLVSQQPAMPVQQPQDPQGPK